MMRRRFLCWLLLAAVSLSALVSLRGSDADAMLLYPQLACTYQDNDSTGTDGTSATFNGKQAGPPTPGRIVAIEAYIRSAGTTNTITGVTINGNAATKIIDDYGRVTSTTGVAIYALVVPTGTTVNVVVSTASTSARFGIGVYSIYNHVGTVAAFNSNSAVNADPTATTLSTRPYGCGIALGGSNQNNTTSWSGMTANFTTLAEGLSAFSGALLPGPTPNNASLAVSVDWIGTAPTETAIVAASWRN